MRESATDLRIPRRMRVIVLAIVVLAFVLGVRMLWGWHANRAKLAMIDAVHRCGEPAAAGEFVYPQIPENEDAWPLFEQLAVLSRNLKVDGPRNSINEYPLIYPPYTPAWLRDAAASESANGPIMVLARSVRSKPRAHFRDKLQSVTSFSIGNLNEQRTIANILADGAGYIQTKGDEVECLDRLLDLEHLARLIRDDDGTLPQSVAGSLQAMLTNEAMTIAPGLNGSAPNAKQRTRDLIAQLLDESANWKGLQQSFIAERIWQWEWIDTISQGKWFIQPLADLEKVRINEIMTICMEATSQRNRPGIMRILDRTGLWTPRHETMPAMRYSRAFDIRGSGYFKSYVETALRVIALNRCSALSLAAQLYRIDHSGRWPEKLSDLAPNYLPAVPLDPFFDDGRTLGYVILKNPQGGERPMIYFDHGDAADADVPATPTYEWIWPTHKGKALSETGRHYLDLSNFTVPASSTQETVNDNK